MKRLFSVPEVAARFDVTNQTVRNWITSGRLTAVQPTRRGRFRIPSEALRAFEHGAASAVRGRAADAEGLAGAQQADQELERIVRAIVASIHPDAVILFGSRAQGHPRPGSDFDLALVVPDGTNRRRLAMKVYESIAAIGDRSIGVDLVVLTPQTIAAERETAGSVVRAVIYDGVALHGSSTFA